MTEIFPLSNKNVDGLLWAHLWLSGFLNDHSENSYFSGKQIYSSTASFVLFISYIQIERDTFKSVTCLLSCSCSRGFITGHSPCSGPDFFHRRGWGAMRRPLRCSCGWLADLQSGCKPSSVTVPASVSLLGLGGRSPGRWRRTDFPAPRERSAKTLISAARSASPRALWLPPHRPLT